MADCESTAIAIRCGGLFRLPARPIARNRCERPRGWRSSPIGRVPRGSGANAAIRISDDGQVPGFVPVEELFRGRHFDQEIVVLCDRWYLSYKLSYRDLVAMMGERGIDLAHTTILRYTPEFEKRWNRFARRLCCNFQTARRIWRSGVSAWALGG